MNLSHLRIALFALICLLASTPVLANTLDATVMHLPIPLLDEQGDHVLNSGKPYSPRMSCGEAGCHDYESITHAFHIEQGRDETSDDFGAKRGLPQLVGPGYFGGYNCMTGNNPDQLAKKVNASADDFADLGSAGWLKRCASCHSGGGWMEKDRNGNRYDEVDPSTVPEFDGDYYNRGSDENNQPTDSSVVSQWDWKKSGVVENDCMQCHADVSNLKTFDPALDVEGAPAASSFRSTLRGSKLIGNGYFRYANTAMLEFINLDMTGENPVNLVTFRKENVEMADDGHGGVSLSFDVATGENGQPILDWNPAAFDATTKKAAIPMVRFPATETCYGCHRTAASRRGFYGFGEDNAAPTYDEDTGVLVDDYQDDVHFGLDWAEANGETRTMTSCNACHTQNYYRESWENTDLDADHNFPKGNSDMDVRNDLDYKPNALSCVYCHDEAETPAIPSGHSSMLEAHKVLWTNAGDMAGYTASSLERITQTHLDQLSCMTCHINGKVYRGAPMQIMYRNRVSEDGKLRVVPYNPKPRYYWKDKNSGRVLTATERNSVFRRVDGVGEIFDPQTGATLATVGTYFSHGSWRYRDPANYEDFISLKQAYDKVLSMKGVSSPDTALVWSEINNYIMTHNTRPAVASVQCEECHATKQNGSFSALISPNGILGSGNEKEITTVPDPRLVDEGLIILDLPHMKMDEAGKVTENVEDILYYTLRNPSLSRLNSEVAPNFSSDVKNDFNGDGKSDVLIRNNATNAWYFYPLNGKQVLPEKGGMPLTRNPDWQVVGTGDYNGDGNSDVLLRHNTRHNWYYYPLNGKQVLLSERGGVPLTRNPDWQVAGTGDFNGDGKDDILIRHTTRHSWYYYPLNGKQVLSEKGGVPLTRNPDWQVAGTGDFNGDGKDDILIRHNTRHNWYYYPLNGKQVLLSERGGVPLTRSPDWQVAGTGDFNGDSKDDILIRHNTHHSWYYYPLNGKQVLPEKGGVPLTRNPEWQVADTGDFNGDGKDDILIRHNTRHNWYYYPLNGKQVLPEKGGVPLTRSPNWAPVTQ